MGAMSVVVEMGGGGFATARVVAAKGEFAKGGSEENLAPASAGGSSSLSLLSGNNGGWSGRESRRDYAVVPDLSKVS